MPGRIWILGASDPEMTAIEHLLLDQGERVEYATVYRDGVRRRVRPSEAYASDVGIGSDLRGINLTAYAVECRPAVLFGTGIDWAGMVYTIDHHRPGDPGYGRTPTEFLRASSLGQVLAHLAGEEGSEHRGSCRVWARPEGRLTAFPEAGSIVYERAQWWVAVAGARREGYRGDYGGLYARWVAIPSDLVLTAAADHCLAAAYRGECPGVDPRALMQWRATSRAEFQRGS